jgi:hypothetical protein
VNNRDVGMQRRERLVEAGGTTMAGELRLLS